MVWHICVNGRKSTCRYKSKSGIVCFDSDYNRYLFDLILCSKCGISVMIVLWHSHKKRLTLRSCVPSSRKEIQIIPAPTAPRVVIPRRCPSLHHFVHHVKLILQSFIRGAFIFQLLSFINKCSSDSNQIKDIK